MSEIAMKVLRSPVLAVVARGSLALMVPISGAFFTSVSNGIAGISKTISAIDNRLAALEGGFKVSENRDYATVAVINDFNIMLRNVEDRMSAVEWRGLQRDGFRVRNDNE